MANKSIKKYHILYIVTFLAVFSLISTTSVSALTYQQDIGVNFTFNTALQLTVSSDLVISNLAPNTASDSNIINVNVSTNAVTGYTLAATVGNNTTYNTRNLIHSNTSLSNNFASIAYSATPTVTTNTNLSSDTWAFSYSVNNGSTWSNYNGLPLYSDTTNVALLKETNGPVSSANGDDIKFKIAAKASETQASGEYNNVINFNLAAKVVPQYTVQFNANGGSGTMPNQTIFRDEPTMLASNSFGPPSINYVFVGWNTAANGSGASYNDQQSVTNLAADGGSITLYAQWDIPLYNRVAMMSKGKETINSQKAAIVAPTESAPISSNSGVYEYNSEAFGAASDARNDHAIFYYRGILDSYSNMGSYGSDGLADAYPNYVKLDNNTCWRIVRTTGSGGVKLLYNGVWNNNTCANTVSDTYSVTSVFYNRATTDATCSSASALCAGRGYIVYVGYNYNNTYSYDSAVSTAVENSALFTNNTPSNLRTAIDNWYASNLTAYTSILETSAGYCNDRSTYTGTTDGTLSASTVPYKTSSATTYFGGYLRVRMNSAITLNCQNPYDLLTTSNGLSYPVALLTADESTFAGSSGYYGIHPYHNNTFVANGGYTWLLTPYYRSASGDEYILYSYDDGSLRWAYNWTTMGGRAVISLNPGIIPDSGTGIATDPWIVSAP